jgi:hypothetical protein
MTFGSNDKFGLFSGGCTVNCCCTTCSGIIVQGAGLGSSIRCGASNTSSGAYSSVFGKLNTNDADLSSVSGYSNCNQGYYSSILGSCNCNYSECSTIIGYQNLIDNQDICSYNNTIFGCKNKICTLNNGCINDNSIYGNCNTISAKYCTINNKIIDDYHQHFIDDYLNNLISLKTKSY